MSNAETHFMYKIHLIVTILFQFFYHADFQKLSDFTFSDFECQNCISIAKDQITFSLLNWVVLHWQVDSAG